MSLGPLKRRSLAIFLFMIAGASLGAAAMTISFVGKSIGLGVMLISLLIGFGFAARLKCPNCGFALSRKLPAGSLPLLWLAKDQCPKCNKPLL
jgi:hypothetical protein